MRRPVGDGMFSPVRTLPFLVLVAAGCTAGRTTVAPAPPTVVRATLAHTIRTLVEPRLEADGWRGEIVEVSQTGQSASNREEEWDETTLRVTFAARGSDGDPRLLTQPEMAALLRGVRSDVRRLVSGFGGENQDTSDGEVFRERWLACPYKIGDTAGWVRATVGPASHKAEETVTRVELVIREMPAK